MIHASINKYIYIYIYAFNLKKGTLLLRSAYFYFSMFVQVSWSCAITVLTIYVVILIHSFIPDNLELGLDILDVAKERVHDIVGKVPSIHQG
ncbi:hypothetical protein BDF20DRAFT_846694 [Mycotypha africana]|uniref:uncharacterized protein n=1 Tax=Mycotypha africana TaxID=64632 RepID=UPI0023018E71|nr:uncharacterized protein BDF20DRAFT_846694 [Mycotypha africana]KAI8991819.1 hypothetical protein BDF20DRAFT_846694 [Mycotypha africana]